MKKVSMIIPLTLLMLGALLAATGSQTQVATAASFPGKIFNQSPIVQPIACNGHTGSHGCGPGWILSLIHI